MRIFTILAIVFGLSLYSNAANTISNGSDNLDNKTLVARIYSDWQTQRPLAQSMFVAFGREEKYKTIKVQIQNRSFSIEPSEIPQAQRAMEVVVLLHPDDQVDESVKNAMNNSIYILPLKEIPAFRFQQALPDTRKSYQLIDALGKPVPNCKVDVFVSDGFDLSKAWLGTQMTDENGYFKTLNIVEKSGQFYLFIKDPNYGSF